MLRLAYKNKADILKTILRRVRRLCEGDVYTDVRRFQKKHEGYVAEFHGRAVAIFSSDYRCYLRVALPLARILVCRAAALSPHMKARMMVDKGVRIDTVAKKKERASFGSPAVPEDQPSAQVSCDMPSRLILQKREPAASRESPAVMVCVKSPPSIHWRWAFVN